MLEVNNASENGFEKRFRRKNGKDGDEKNQILFCFCLRKTKKSKRVLRRLRKKVAKLKNNSFCKIGFDASLKNNCERHWWKAQLVKKGKKVWKSFTKMILTRKKFDIAWSFEGNLVSRNFQYGRYLGIEVMKRVLHLFRSV